MSDAEEFDFELRRHLLVQDAEVVPRAELRELREAVERVEKLCLSHYPEDRLSAWDVLAMLRGRA